MGNQNKQRADNTSLKLFLCGDVMTGRGIDQALPVSVDPRLYEQYVKNAREYLKLAERKHGNIRTPVSYTYLWGDAMEVWEREQPALNIINLETSITNHDSPWPGKGINYRMHPGNAQLLTTAGIDFCSLANNHTLDWQQAGLVETIETLDKVGITHAGAGLSEQAAIQPVTVHVPDGRVILLAGGVRSSGIPSNWKAAPHAAGLNLIELDEGQVKAIARQINQVRQPGDVVVYSIHWGGNWAYEIPEKQRAFARQLIDQAGVDVVHGHSSHHPKGIEVYNDRLIIYGAGDFINDYEGIDGREEFRDDLTLMYFPTLDRQTGRLISLKMVPMQIRKFSLHHASKSDAAWLEEMMHRQCQKLGTDIRLTNSQELELIWR